MNSEDKITTIYGLEQLNLFELITFLMISSETDGINWMMITSDQLFTINGLRIWIRLCWKRKMKAKLRMDKL